MKSLKYVLLATAGLSLLAACGSSEPDRAEGGAATGAATGATIGAVADAQPAQMQPLAMAGDDVRAAQQKLQAQGLYRGRIDGLYGPQTRAAVIAYQRRNNMQQTGQLDQMTLAGLNGGSVGSNSLALATGGDQVRSVQQVLQAQGYYHGRIDGRFGPGTRAAVVAYQRHNDLRATAQLDGDTMARLSGNGATTSYGSAGPNRSTGANQ